MILAVGYRVRSPRGTQFRQWATARLGVPGQGLHHGRRAPEAVRRRLLRRTARPHPGHSFLGAPRLLRKFFAVVQNKMHWAARSQTAAEVIARRADAARPHMGLTTWTSSRPRRNDTGVAKNYLNREEIETLNLIVSAYLDFAELRPAAANPWPCATGSPSSTTFSV